MLLRAAFPKLVIFRIQNFFTYSEGLLCSWESKETKNRWARKYAFDLYLSNLVERFQFLGNMAK